MKNIFVLVFVVMAGSSFAQTPVKLWETDAVFSGPESVAYDHERQVLYVSNMRKNKKGDGRYGGHFISKVSLSGEVVDLKWIDGLTEPTGVKIFNDHLYIVERLGLAVFSLAKNNMVSRIRIKDTGFFNDVDILDDGTVFVSNSTTKTIYKIVDGVVSVWYSNQSIAKPNGILLRDGKLLVAANIDAALKAIDITDRSVAVISPVKRGIIDGIQLIGDDILVSVLEGYIFRITMNGKVSKILDTTTINTDIADFAYIKDKNLLIIPAVQQHKLVAYKLDD